MNQIKMSDAVEAMLKGKMIEPNHCSYCCKCDKPLTPKTEKLLWVFPYCKECCEKEIEGLG